MRTLCLVIALLSLSGCATKAAQLISPEPTAGASRSMRVMTFNIQSGRKGLDNVAALIKEADADVVALQEVDRNTTRAYGVDQLAALAEATGLRYYAFFKATEFYGGDYGNAILSRYPLKDAEKLGLPVEGAERRVVGRAVVEAPAGEVMVYVTHLTNLPTRSRLRQMQARHILSWMKTDSRPRMLMGDFNDGETSATVGAFAVGMSEAFMKAGHGPSATFPFPIIPDARFDYVFASADFEATHAHVIPKVASDHYPVVADFRIISGGTVAAQK